MLEKLTPMSIGKEATEYRNLMGEVVCRAYKDSSGHVTFYDAGGREIMLQRITEPSGRTDTYDYSGNLISTTAKDDSGVATATDPYGYELGKTYTDDSGAIYVSRVHGEYGKKTFSDVAEEMELEAIASHEKQLREYLGSRKEWSFCVPSTDQQNRMRPLVPCSPQDAAEYLRFAAQLLYENGVKPESFVGEYRTRKDVIKRGPFGLLSRDDSKKVRVPVERYWELRDSGIRIEHRDETVDIYEDHEYICLLPGGKLMKRTSEEKSFRDYKIPYQENEKGSSALSMDHDPAGYVALADWRLSESKVDMSFEKYMQQKAVSPVNDLYIDEIRQQVKKEQEELMEPRTTEQREFSDLHWSAAIVFILVLLTSKVFPGWVPYMITGTAFIILWTQYIQYDAGLRPMSRTVWFEVIVTALTGVTMLVKYKFNEWLYHNYYDNRIPLILLGCIIAIMLASATGKLSASAKGTDVPVKLRAGSFSAVKLVSAPVLIGAAALRLWSKRTFMSDPARYSVILLAAEAACIVFGADWKICAGLYLLYGIFNASDLIDAFRPGEWSWFFRTEVGVCGFIAAAAAGLVTLWVILEAVRKKKDTKESK